MEYEECLNKTGLGTQMANIIEVLKITKRLEGLKQEDFEMEEGPSSNKTITLTLSKALTLMQTLTATRSHLH